ncbi:LAME_0H16116g1_1 [Lachancea meyersii CBS 8951]|uniref:Meiotic nuclear division protein 1 n=1 Tax=Lachancea meyersii CBS 8951 TaxID=1266667 RepID=A0A1G4KI39_9SACH|nr:LAME_0H16116g1_1 [Lachancea meyersii CBS 8951]
MPPKGKATVSMAQKKANVLRFFQDEHSVYNIKELEKLIPKKCNGVSPMLVKGLIQEMIDEDGIISVEKCGSTNVYWCFKNQIIMKTQQEMTSLKTRIETAEKEALEAKRTLEQNEKSIRKEFYDLDGETVSRAEQLEKLEALNAQAKSLRATCDNMMETTWDQSQMKSRMKALAPQLQKLEMVTDNIELVTGFLCRRFIVNPSDLKAELGIPEEFLEFPGLPDVV